MEGMQKEIAKIQACLARIEENLKEHMRRSLANEKAVEILAAETKDLRIQATKNDTMIKSFGWIVTISTVIYSLMKFIT